MLHFAPHEAFTATGEEWLIHLAVHAMHLAEQWDETFDIGADTGTPADNRDYKVPFRFNGTLHKVTVRVQPRALTPAEEALLRREGRRGNRASE